MKQLITLLGLLVSAVTVAQEIDTIRVGEPFQRYGQLEFGSYQQVTFTELNGEVRFPVLKTIRVEEVELNDRTYLAIRHDWSSGKPDMNGSFDYLCEPETLRPVQHIRKTPKNGTEAFAFYENQVTSLDTVADNSLSDFAVPLSVPTYNWEIDLETYSLLPMREGYRAVMNFYHPGGSPPGYYLLEVKGTEQLALPGGQMLDCWVLFTDYGGRQPTRFWYTKGTQQFIKMEGQYQHLKIRKVRLMD